MSAEMLQKNATGATFRVKLQLVDGNQYHDIQSC